MCTAGACMSLPDEGEPDAGPDAGEPDGGVEQDSGTDAGETPDADQDAAVDAGGSSDGGGCDCSVPRARGERALLGVSLLAAVILARVRKRRGGGRAKPSASSPS